MNGPAAWEWSRDVRIVYLTTLNNQQNIVGELGAYYLLVTIDMNLNAALWMSLFIR
jgi:hypothetical protein